MVLILTDFYTIDITKQGNYSENDRQNWTPELRKALNFDQMQALQVDNGKLLFLSWADYLTYSMGFLFSCMIETYSYLSVILL